MAKNKAMGDQPKKKNGDGPSRQSAQPAQASSAQSATQPQLTMLALYVRISPSKVPALRNRCKGLVRTRS